MSDANESIAHQLHLVREAVHSVRQLIEEVDSDDPRLAGVGGVLQLAINELQRAADALESVTSK